ncbi:MAG: lysylphosphatidylglycerol synthase domain-containing protein [Planctomycetota bacterium]|nr:lysylphosphatidylglycerol synthase domain-containing protein [Planctomycetota bacterium]
MKTTFRISVSVAIAGVLLVLLMLWGGVSPASAVDTLMRLPFGVYLLALGIHLIVYCLRAARFGVLIPRDRRPGFRRLLIVSGAHNMASYVLPAKTGEASLVVYLRLRCGVPTTLGLASLLVARLLDGATLCCGLAIACLYLGQSGRYDHLEWLGTVGAGLFGLCLLFVGLSVRGHLVVRVVAGLLRWLKLYHWHLGERVLNKANQLAGALRSAGRGGGLYLAALTSIPIWLGVFGFYAVLSRAMGLPEEFNLAEATFGSSLAVMFNLLPVNGMAGMGTQETGWVIGFSEFLGVDRQLALSTGIGVHLVQLFNVVVLGTLAHFAMGVMPRLRFEQVEEQLQEPPSSESERVRVSGETRGQKEAQIDLHRKLAPRYALRYGFEFSRLFQQDWHSEMISHVPRDAKEVLDIGCGTGFFLAELEEKHPGSVGLDISHDMLKVSERYVPGVKLVTGDAEKMPFRRGIFDAVFCKGSLHHTRDHVGFLRNCNELLRPDGVLIMSEPCNDNPLIRIARKILYRRSQHFDEGDQGFTRQGILGLCEKAGFEVTKVKKYGVLAYVFAGFPDHLGVLRYVPGNALLTRFFIHLDRLLCAIPGLSILGFHIVVVGRPRS